MSGGPAKFSKPKPASKREVMHLFPLTRSCIPDAAVRQMFQSMSRPKEDFTRALTESEVIKILKAPLAEVQRLRALLAETIDRLERIETGKPRKYTSKPRTVQIPEFLLPYLERMIKDKDDPDDFLFTSKNKGPKQPVNSTAVQRELKKECERLGMTGNIGTHSCRKGYAMHVFLKSGASVLSSIVHIGSQGKDPVATAKLLGHQDTASLLAYLRVASEELRQVDTDAVKEYLGMIKEAEKTDGKDAKRPDAAPAAASLAAEAPADKKIVQRLLSRSRPEEVDVTGKLLEVQIGQDLEKGTRPFTPAELGLLDEKAWLPVTETSGMKKPSPKQLTKQLADLSETRDRMLAIIFSLCAFGCRIGGLLALQVVDAHNKTSGSWYKSCTIYDKGTEESRKRAEQREEKKTKIKAAKRKLNQEEDEEVTEDLEYPSAKRAKIGLAPAVATKVCCI